MSFYAYCGMVMALVFQSTGHKFVPQPSDIHTMNLNKFTCTCASVPQNV